MTPTRLTREDAFNAILDTNEKLAQVMEKLCQFQAL
jgi:hypothetical protein